MNNKKAVLQQAQPFLFFFEKRFGFYFFYPVFPDFDNAPP
jgi:hypothetical protein